MDGKNGLMLLVVSIASTLSLAGCTTTTQKTQADPLQVALTKEDVAATPEETKKAALVNVELGLGYLNQGQVARAKSKLTHAVKLAPNEPEPHSALAFFRERVGDVKEAEKSHKKAVKLGKAKGQVYNNYGAFLCRQGRMKEADTAFKTALSDKEYPRTADVYENAGVCAKKSTDFEAASHYLKTALQQDPRRATALLELTDLNLQQGRYQDAQSYLKQYKLMAEPTSRSLWLAIQLFHHLQDKDAVASNALILKNLFEDSPEYQLYLKSDINKS